MSRTRSWTPRPNATAGARAGDAASPGRTRPCCARSGTGPSSAWLPTVTEDGAPADTVKLFQLHVDPDNWRGGIGTALHRTCVAGWRSDGIATAHLEVYWHNQRARAFYTRHGWQPDETRRPTPDATHLDLILPVGPASS
ncbi:GNAT family N-acetyltransferase OS=Streptomyces rimosus subsp. rimosus (strain ATCC/ DSM 40260 / JCM 4667 / NRRL 2234) OX=1265868 GN=SRIM_009310 PE=4 SV=1 [Streptomyces rimosus subsp. rimosus]